MKVCLASHAEGVLIPVRAHPGARRPGVAGIREGALRVRISASPEKGRANRALIALLSKVLDVPKSSLSLVSGEKSRQKCVLVRGLAMSDLEIRLERALQAARK